MGRFVRLFKKDLENEVDVVGCRCRKFGKNDQSKIFFPFSGCFGHRKLKNHANCYCNEIHVTGYRVCLFTSICFLRHDRCLKQATIRRRLLLQPRKYNFVFCTRHTLRARTPLNISKAVGSTVDFRPFVQERS